MPTNNRGKARSWRGKRKTKSNSTKTSNANRVGTLRRDVSRPTSTPSSRLSPSMDSSPTNYIRAPRAHTSRASLPTESVPGQDSYSAQTEDQLHEIVMAVQMKDRGTVGCCYYVAAEESLYFMEDVPLGDVDVIEQLKLLVFPTVVLLPSSSDDTVLRCLDPHAPSEVDDMEACAYRLPYTLQLRPPRDFSYEAGRERLIDLRIGASDGPHVQYITPGDASSIVDAEDDNDTESAQSGRHARLIMLSGWVAVESRLTVACANAVLNSLSRRHSTANEPGDHGFRVSNVIMFSLRDSMFINSDTVTSLQLVLLEARSALDVHRPSHASSRPKESVSVHGLFQSYAKSPRGKHLLKQYFLRPSLNLDVINERHNTVACFTKPKNESTVSRCSKAMKGVGNVRGMLIQLRRGISAGSGKAGTIAVRNWSGLLKFVFSALTIHDTLLELHGGEGLSILSKIHSTFSTQNFQEIGRMISEIVDFDESENERRAVVKAGVDGSLDEQKRLYAGLEHLLREVAVKIAEDIPQGLPDDLNVAYFPQIGFLLTMPMDHQTCTALWEGNEDDPWEKMFSSESQVYYKSRKMREMDESLGDVYTEICDREIEILHNLAENVLQYEAVLALSSDVCGELDCLLALALGAREHGFHRPRMIESNEIRIEAGWHPLQKLTCETTFVPNDALIVGGRGSTSSSTQGSMAAPKGPCLVLLTGPNYSGKSVYLKQVAIITYLAHIGSFVPAASAQIGLTDAILTRVSTRESVSSPHSAFMTDLLQVSRALRLATPRSLLVIDEFGKGTAAPDGPALAAGVFNYLANLGDRAPKALGASHFHEIFSVNGLSGPGLQCMHMEIRLDEQAKDVKDQIAYLYVLRDGRSSESLGTQCAALSGMPAEIVARARELAAMIDRGEDLVEACSALHEAEERELRVAEQVAQAFLADDLTGDPGALLEELFRPETAYLIEDDSSL